MRSKLEVAGHALHPMLIAFPLGLLGTSVVWDICALATARPLWGTIAYWTITAGIISGLVAAVPGFIDWLYIPKRTRARTVGIYHMLLNVTVLVLFAISLLLRHSASGGYPQAGFLHMLPGWIGVALAVVSAWFGGELVETLGIAVHEGANPNAPSSLRSRRPSRVAPGSGHI
ncbi:MAG TPA: DUF2231 domain-containing protein [Polyangia bacterium]